MPQFQFEAMDATGQEIRDVIERHKGELLSIGSPTTTLEDLFLRIIRESEAHPGRRVRASRGS